VIFLRKRILLVIVSLLIMGGYSHQVLANCDDRAPQKMQQSGGKKEQQPSQKTNDNCHCLCHQTISNSLTPSVLPHPVLVAQPAHFVTGDAPPDRPPQGIDHPPQLA
jgi:hypothetical protein